MNPADRMPRRYRAAIGEIVVSHARERNVFDKSSIETLREVDRPSLPTLDAGIIHKCRLVSTVHREAGG